MVLSTRVTLPMGGSLKLKPNSLSKNALPVTSSVSPAVLPTDHTRVWRLLRKRFSSTMKRVWGFSGSPQAETEYAPFHDEKSVRRLLLTLGWTPAGHTVTSAVHQDHMTPGQWRR